MLGNLTELVIAVTALRAGEYMLAKASVAGAIVTSTRLMASRLFLATVCAADSVGLEPGRFGAGGRFHPALERRAAEMASAFSGARKNRLDLSRSSSPRCWCS